MGANLTRRLMARTGIAASCTTSTPTRSRRSKPKAPRAPPTLRDFVEKLERPRAIWIMGAGRHRAADPRAAAAAPGRRRHRDRRRQFLLPGRHRPGQAGQAGRPSTTSTAGRAAGCGGLDRGFCLMIGGEKEAGAAAETRFSFTIAPGGERRSGHPEPGPGPQHRVARIPALRAERGRATSSRWSTTVSSTA